MKTIDNVNTRVVDDMRETIHKGSKLSIAAACFTLYAYQELKKELSSIEEMRFIFTSPAFLSHKTEETGEDYFVAPDPVESALYGTEFEMKLRNSLMQKAIAKECADWIRAKVHFKSNMTGNIMQENVNIDESTYMGVKEFSAVGLGCERGNNVNYAVMKTEATENGRMFLNMFDQLWQDSSQLRDVTDTVAARLEDAYRDHSPEFLYYVTLYHVFGEYLKDLSQDELPDEESGVHGTKVWQMLYDFQRDAAIGIISKLEKYNGCILADSVGLGKTLTALAVIKYYEEQGKKVLVLCPKKLAENWNMYRNPYDNNPFLKDPFHYEVLFHTDLSRTRGESNGIDLSKVNWGIFDLIVIDESHNFRNGGSGGSSRYDNLMNKVIRQGVRTKVLMLSATPVNNRFSDLQHQLELAYEGTPELMDKKLDTQNPINQIFKDAQKTFNAWTKLPVDERDTASLLRELDFDFFKLLDSVTIARSRKHIQKYYDMSVLGAFPKRLKPETIRPQLTDEKDAVSYDEIYELIMQLNLELYTPSRYIYPSRMDKYMLKGQKGLSLQGREEGIRHLMGVNLMKRLESSVDSFRKTLDNIKARLDSSVQAAESFLERNQASKVEDEWADEDLDIDDSNQDFIEGSKSQIDMHDMDAKSWHDRMVEDQKVMQTLLDRLEDITVEHDSKLNALKDFIRNKQENPINPGNRKILIFTAFADTADYLYEHISDFAKKEYQLETAEITGSSQGKATVRGLKKSFDSLLAAFSPISKGRSEKEQDKPEIDILIATDCISEGQNLQDCDCCVNYDIHWNPVRIIQRFGRIDRIGSRNACIQLVNFWPDVTLDSYIHLKSRVETRMKISVMTAAGDDNIIDPADAAKEDNELAFRERQLRRMQEEIVDMEDAENGISITDLGLNDFQMDLLGYIKKHPDFGRMPLGMEAVVHSNEDCPPGVIFVLKNRKGGEVDRRNRMHPFYLVYVQENGEIAYGYMQPRQVLESLQMLCKGKNEPDAGLCRQVAQATKNWTNMQPYTDLLSKAAASAVKQKAESEFDSLFSMGGTTALKGELSDLDDFELISYFVVQEGMA